MRMGASADAALLTGRPGPSSPSCPGELNRALQSRSGARGCPPFRYPAGPPAATFTKTYPLSEARSLHVVRQALWACALRRARKAGVAERVRACRRLPAARHTEPWSVSQKVISKSDPLRCVRGPGPSARKLVSRGRPGDKRQVPAARGGPTGGGVACVAVFIVFGPKSDPPSRRGLVFTTSGPYARIQTPIFSTTVTVYRGNKKNHSMIGAF